MAGASCGECQATACIGLDCDTPPLAVQEKGIPDASPLFDNSFFPFTSRRANQVRP
jgi:hypothetical protein